MSRKAKIRRTSAEVQVNLGEVVREFRHRLGLTQDELGWRSNLHRTYIADVERGARNVTLRSIINLAKALETTVGQLLSHATESQSAREGEAGEPTVIDGNEVLLVDDSAADASHTERAFRKAGVKNRVHVVRSIEEARKYLFGAKGKRSGRVVRPTLIMLDVRLPDGVGAALLRDIKSEKRTREIPVVVLAARWNDRELGEHVRLGAPHYIVKPFAIESLLRLAPKLSLGLKLEGSAT